MSQHHLLGIHTGIGAGRYTIKYMQVYISLRMRKMYILEKLNFKISWGSMPPDPPTVLAPSALDTIFARLNRACYYQWVILSIILRILPTQKDVSFLIRKKGAPSVLYGDIFFKDC